MNEQPPAISPGSLSALAAYYSRCESALQSTPPTPPPPPPPEVRILLRTITPRQSPQVVAQVAQMTNRHPGIVARWLGALHTEFFTEQPPAQPADPAVMIALREVSRTVTFLADQLAIWTGTDEQAWTPAERLAFDLARAFGWRPTPTAPAAEPPDQRVSQMEKTMSVDRVNELFYEKLEDHEGQDHPWVRKRLKEGHERVRKVLAIIEMMEQDDIRDYPQMLRDAVTQAVASDSTL